MMYRRRQRWLRRLALGFAVATALFAGKVSVAWAVVDEGEPIQVIPYLSHGMLTQADASQAVAETIHDPYLTDVFVRQGESLGGPDGDQVAFANAIKSQPAPSGDELAFANAIGSQETATRPDDRADRFTGLQQPPVISYLSHGMAADGEVGARPDNRADRFAHSDVTPQPELSSNGWNVEWNEALSFGIGGLVLVLALGLGIGYLRRPRLAL
jgi:hypothetical protein